MNNYSSTDNPTDGVIITYTLTSPLIHPSCFIQYNLAVVLERLFIFHVLYSTNSHRLERDYPSFTFNYSLYNSTKRLFIHVSLQFVQLDKERLFILHVSHSATWQIATSILQVSYSTTRQWQTGRINIVLQTKTKPRAKANGCKTSPCKCNWLTVNPNIQQDEM